MPGWSRSEDLRVPEDVDFLAVPFPPGPVRGLYVRVDGGRCTILVDSNLPSAERLWTAMHELAHHERGGGCYHPNLPNLLRVMVSREEERIERIVADRLLPLDELEEMCRRRSEFEAVTVDQAAEELEVAGDVVERQLRRLVERRSA